MTLGSLNHLTLTVTDMARSEPFYNAVLGFMGYRQVAQTDEFVMYQAQDTATIFIAISNPDALNPIHDRYSPGLHHLAFNADNRAQVDSFYQRLVEIGAIVLDAPAEYPQYTPGYYAVFFTDPDGIKLELVHKPAVP